MLARAHDALGHLADVEGALALVDGGAGALEHAPRGVHVLEELGVRRGERVGVEVLDDRAVEEGLLRAVDGGVVGETGVEPGFAVAEWGAFSTD